MLILSALFICLIKAFDFKSVGQAIDLVDQIAIDSNISKTNGSYSVEPCIRSNANLPLQVDQIDAMTGRNDDVQTHVTTRNEPIMITSKSVEFLDFIKQTYSIDGRSATVGGSDFCFIDQSMGIKYRKMNENVRECGLKSTISNLFEPVRTYNVSLMIFYDRYFEQKGDAEKNIKYIIKGLQEAYATYDIINEIGFIKFYVVDIVRIAVPTDDIIYIDYYYRGLLDYVRRMKIALNRRTIPIWLTNSRILDKRMLKKNNFSRLEGLARTNSFCSDGTIVLVNCNSLSKSTIILMHEAGEVFVSGFF